LNPKMSDMSDRISIADFHNLKGQKKPSKYKNRTAVSSDGKTFDSQKERDRYEELRLLQLASKITSLQCQPSFKLLPLQVICGRVEKGVNYTADFSYWENDLFVIEDVKGRRTADYVIRRKLMKFVLNLDVREI